MNAIIENTIERAVSFDDLLPIMRYDEEHYYRLLNGESQEDIDKFIIFKNELFKIPPKYECEDFF